MTLSPRRIFLTVFALCAGVLCMSWTADVDAAAGDQAVSGTQGDTVEGRYRIESHDNSKDRLHLDLRIGSRHRMGMTVPKASLRELPGGVLEMRREAGTVRFLSGFEPGRFVFLADPSYRKALEARGKLDAGRAAGSELFELAMLDVTLRFVDDLAEVGYDESLERLEEMRIHDADAGFVRSLQNLDLDGWQHADLPASRLVELRIHGVRADDVLAWHDAGIEGLGPARAVEFAIHGVSPQFVAEMNALGLRGLAAPRLVEFRIHGVDAEFVRDMQIEGYENLPPSRLVEFRIHGVDAKFVREMKAAGYDNLPPSRLVEFRIHGVDADYVHKLASRGVTGLSAAQLVERRIHRG